MLRLSSRPQPAKCGVHRVLQAAGLAELAPAVRPPVLEGKLLHPLMVGMV